MSIVFFIFDDYFFNFAESEVYMDISMESVGNRIKTRRKELGLTQTDI